ncbi:MAG TPA: sigma-70 family RNA polymerase sigma factor [Solirubrobacteraceae bacterium]|nr:sigma-70 family RNA polymerase sigma factor [Solirubrobacteraceae bacterium]
MALFRAGHDDAFRAIHDRYRQRLFGYTRQMLPARQDAEDALQDVFVRAYSGLRASQGRLVLRAWLYRIAHNRCIDELRRPAPPSPEVLELVRAPSDDPIAAADQRESLRRLVIDVRRLPEQQRSALLMRELGGMAYADMADALGVSVPAVKSLLVRARIALAQALEARDTACSDIRGQLTLAHDRGVRPSGTARRHMRDCSQCKHFHTELRGISRRFAALAPTVGPMGVIAKVLGIGGGGGAAASSGAIAAGGAAGTGGAIASVGLFATGAGHIATLIAAAAVTAGGAVEIQSSIAPHAHHVRHTRPAATAPAVPNAQPQQTAASSQPAPATSSAQQTVIVPARRSSTVTLPVRHKQVRHRQQVPAGHITDPAAQSPSSTTTGGTDSSGTSSTTTDGSGTPDGSLDGTSGTNGKSTTTTTTTTDPATALDQSSTTTSTTGNGNPPTTSTSSPGTTSPGAPTTGPGTIVTATSSSSAPTTSGSGNGA